MDPHIVIERPVSPLVFNALLGVASFFCALIILLLRAVGCMSFKRVWLLEALLGVLIILKLCRGLTLYKLKILGT